MDLGELADKIESGVFDAGEVRGSVQYLGIRSNLGQGEIETFSYKFPQGKAKENIPYDSDERVGDESMAIHRASSLLQYYVNGGVAVEVLGRDGNSARVRVYLESEIDDNFEERRRMDSEREEALHFYLEAEEDGLSPEETGDSALYEVGREIWKEKQ